MSPNDKSGFDQGEYERPAKAARIDRPPRVVTDDNATVADRAGAWGSVERTLAQLNRAAEILDVPGIDELRQATHAYDLTVDPPGSVMSALAWRRVVRAQWHVLTIVRSAAWLDLVQLELEAFDAALAYYREIGGAVDRAPAVGGIS